MDDLPEAGKTIASFLQAFIANSGLKLRFQIKLRGPKSTSALPDSRLSSVKAEIPRSLYVEFSGPDTQVLTGHFGEVLNALEHVATKILRLEPEEHDLVAFDADHFKADRDRDMRDAAAEAIERVRSTGRPHAFPAMTSRERRMLHLILSESGLPTASSGEGPGRFVVLYPAGADIPDSIPSAPSLRRPDADRVRDTFRHR